MAQLPFHQCDVHYAIEWCSGGGSGRGEGRTGGGVASIIDTIIFIVIVIIIIIISGSSSSTNSIPISRSNIFCIRQLGECCWRGCTSIVSVVITSPPSNGSSSSSSSSSRIAASYFLGVGSSKTANEGS